MAPVPRKRKSTASAKSKRRKNTAGPLKIVGGTKVRINKKRLGELRNDADFSAIIRLGRALNALAFAMDLIHQSFESNPRGERNKFRSALTLAGYTFESLQLLRSLEKTYKGEPFFSKAQDLLDNKSRWKAAEKLRNRSGFHLDHDDEITTEMLSVLPEKDHDFLSAQDLPKGMTVAEYHFNLADEIDSEYFAKEFRTEKHKTVRQTHTEIVTSLGNLTRDTSFAVLEIHRELLKKLDLFTSK